MATIEEWARASGPWAPLVLSGAAFVEYVFPPFPGDAVTVVGASLAALGVQPWWVVFVAVVGGSMAGSAVMYFVGRWAGRKAERAPEHPARFKIFSRDHIHRFEAAYRRHGRLYILVNRFLPGVRAMFFVLAGASGMRFGEVMVYGTISAAAWSGLLLSAGWAVGRNVDRLHDLFHAYTHVAWIAVAAAAVATLAVYAVRRIRRGR